MTSCRLCRSPLDGAASLTIDRAPSGAQLFAATVDVARSAAIALTIVACPACGLVQSSSPAVDGYRRAITAAGVSRPMREHRLAQATRLRAISGRAGLRLAVVGCGNGYELPLLDEAGFRPEGVEAGGAPAGYSGRWPVHDGYPESGTTLPGAPYEAFACYNFLEHAPDPRGFLTAIARSLAEAAIGVVEVPNGDRQRDAGRAADYVADHLSYFDAATLRTALVLSGFEVVALTEVRDGENLEAIVRRHAAPPFAAQYELLQRTRSDVAAFFGRSRESGKPALAWGASHRALTLLAAVPPGDAPSAIIDAAAFKHGRYAPASGITITGPSTELLRSVHAVLILAPGYEGEIAAALRRDFAFAGEVWTVDGHELRRLG